MKKPVIIISAVVAVGIVTAIVIAFGRIENAARDGAKEAVNEKIDEAINGGVKGVIQGDGVADEAAQAYAENIKFELTPTRTTPGTVTVSGLVRNNGAKKITYLEVEIALVDADGVVLSQRSDLLAHNLPFGDNNSPVLPGTAKRIICPITNSDWKDGKVVASITKIAIK
jgi:hypothetical protein